MRNELLACSLALGAVAAPLAAQGDFLYSVSSTDGLLRRVNPLTGAVLSSVQMVTNNNVNAQGCTGLSCDPTTGQLYAIMREVSQPTVRKLARVNPGNGAATILGALNDNFAALAFRPDGVLFAVTGDGALVPETLYTLNPANAQPTVVMTLGNGGPGESIAFGADGFLYHLSGCCTPNVDTVLERIDTATNTVTVIPLSGFAYFEILSATLLAGGNLLAADLNDALLVITTSGFATHVGQFAYSAVKGLALVPSASTQPVFRPYGAGCTAASSQIPLLLASGIPTGGQNVQFDLALAPANSFGAFALGSGNTSVPFPSPACQAQIVPADPNLMFFATTATGTWTATFQVPPGFVLDVYCQVGVFDGPTLLVSNPVQAHVL